MTPRVLHTLRMSQTSAKSSGRLDEVLALEEGIQSRSMAKRLIDAGRVAVGGRKVEKASYSIQKGENIEFQLFEVPSIPSDEGASSLEVLYEDEACLVVNKPAGIAVHPGSGMEKGERTILDELRPLFRRRALPFSESSILVHRLDKETTGCLLIAKTPVIHKALQKQFADRAVKKTYLALAYGTPKFRAAKIDAPIGRHTAKRTAMSVYQTSKSRAAQTTYRTIDSAGTMTLLECDLHTGRTHQIRVHLASIGHPVLGDRTYATKESRECAEDMHIDFLCLHAWKLQFASGRKKIHVEAPIPVSFRNVCKRTRVSMREA